MQYNYKGQQGAHFQIFIVQPQLHWNKLHWNSFAQFIIPKSLYNSGKFIPLFCFNMTHLDIVLSLHIPEKCSNLIQRLFGVFALQTEILSLNTKFLKNKVMILKTTIDHLSSHTPVTLSRHPSCAATSWIVFGCTPKTGSCPPTDIPPYLYIVEKTGLMYAKLYCNLFQQLQPKKVDAIEYTSKAMSSSVIWIYLCSFTQYLLFKLREVKVRKEKGQSTQRPQLINILLPKIKKKKNN